MKHALTISFEFTPARSEELPRSRSEIRRGTRADLFDLLSQAPQCVPNTTMLHHIGQTAGPTLGIFLLYLTFHADSIWGCRTGLTSRNGGTSPDSASTPKAARSSSSKNSSSGGPSKTVTIQSWHATPRMVQLSQSILVVISLA
jgi:hypothetical protein